MQQPCHPERSEPRGGERSRRTSFRISVPATSANLGPGFDAVGIALTLRVSAEVTPAPRFALDFVPGPDAPTHDGLAMSILRAMRRIDRDLPCVRVKLDNKIPLGKGLGSSAAATVLGLAVASRAHERAITRRELAALACEIEGHPDNALAAVFGSVVVAVSAAEGNHVRLPVPKNLQALAIVPDVALSTAESRALLPERYDRSDVAFNLQRAALLGAALASDSPSALRHAMRDRVHQPYRAARIPGMAEALALEHRSLLGSALSGAGPSLIAFVRPGRGPAVARLLEGCFARAGVGTRSLALGLAQRGLLCTPPAAIKAR